MATLYDRSVIPSVKSLEEAHDGIQTTSFDDCLSAFETLVKNCGQNDRYGLTLVHRHTDVEPNTRIFDFGNTLQTFPLQDDAEELHGAKIRPKSYALRGMWKPYEYELGVRDDADDLFLDSVKELLQQHKLDKYVGLRRYSPDDPEELEITEQWGISLKIPLDQTSNVQGEGYKTTFWAFPTGTLPSGEPKKYRCACTDTGGPRGPNHNHIDRN